MEIEVIRKIKPYLDSEEVFFIEKAMNIIEEIQMTLQDNECKYIEDNGGYWVDYDYLEEALDILIIVKNMEEIY